MNTASYIEVSELNHVPSGERIHIGFFGKRNAGKSSLLNAVTGQDFAVVSDVAGTTTDVVRKSMELLPLGPVLIIDTPGFDDSGELGELRVKQARRELSRVDIAVLVVDASEFSPSKALSEADCEIIEVFKQKQVEYLIAYNKCDLSAENSSADERAVFVSAKTGFGINELKERISRLVSADDPKLRLVGDLVKPLDTVVLVVPIDKAAPKGRLILPQQQVIRDLLEIGAAALVTRETELAETLSSLKNPPRAVITDSQAFARVSAETPLDVPLTSFSIIMARYKGFLTSSVHGVKTLNKLNDGDTVLICEGCTHHRQCDDIGTVKLPRWIKEFTKKDVQFEFSSGMGFPEDLRRYSLVLHCGGCMLNPREIKRRVSQAEEDGVPFTNYGVAIAHMQGILRRCLGLFPELSEEYDD